MNILLCSVGRRPYLVRWFQEALIANELEGKVIAADFDPLSAAGTVADTFMKAPPVAHPKYREWLKEAIISEQVELAVSINDFELSEWANMPQDEDWRPLVKLSSQTQTLVEDKYTTAERLDAVGLLSPPTWLGTSAHSLSNTKTYITKGRFGSASRGLRFVDAKDLPDAIDAATQEVTNRRGEPALQQTEIHAQDLVIVQERIQGTEYGLDVVSDLKGDFAGVLVREKIAMRAGETDRAVSVDANKFEKVAQDISAAIPHRGTMDVDVIVDEDGKIYVIDINPRFGGGYPFSHLAGARVPNAYVAWAAGRKIDPSWLTSEANITGSKYVEAVKVS